MAAAAIGCTVIGCNQSKQTAAPVKKASPEYFKVDAAKAASVRGKARFEGKLPAAKRISMDAEEACQALHKSPVFDERVLTGKGGELANALVYIKTGLEGKIFAPAAEAVVLEQTGCQFTPRVIALRTGQTLAVKNSDPVSHNVHPVPQNNRDWNQQQAPQAPDIERRFSHPEIAIPVKCNVHSWMKAYVGVLDHPFFAVTSRKGEFVLDGLPPGQYTVAAWHEAFGEATQSVTLQAGEAGTASFEFR